MIQDKKGKIHDGLQILNEETKDNITFDPASQSPNYRRDGHYHSYVDLWIGDNDESN